MKIARTLSSCLLMLQTHRKENDGWRLLFDWKFCMVSKWETYLLHRNGEPDRTFCILQCFNRVLCPYLIQTGNIFLWMGFIFMMRSVLCHSQPKHKIILAGFNTCYFLQINWEILEPASSSSVASQLLHSWLHCSRNGWAPRSVPICYQWPCISTWSIHQCQK